MQRMPLAASSTWFAALVALLVALGAQVLLESIVPASLADLPLLPSRGAYHVAGEALWPGASAIRVLSFAIGGSVGVLLARSLSRSLLAMLLGIAILATIFEQFPGRGSPIAFLLWSIAGPAGVTLGAWATNASRKVA